jgi:hypothetical protein
MTNLLRFVWLLAAGLLSISLHAQTPEEEPTTDCGFAMQLTAVGTTAVGELVPINGINAQLLTVRWFDTKTGYTFCNGNQLNYQLPDYGDYSIGVEYTTDLLGSPLGCATQQIQPLNLVAPSCIQPLLNANLINTVCPTTFAPVCGCDGVTYLNECLAETAGITTWWAGECGSQPSVVDCGATDFGWHVVSGSPATGYTVVFDNWATSEFTNMQLDLGDGSIVSLPVGWNTFQHTYAAGGNYQASLSAWKVGQVGCISSVSKNFATDAASFVHAAPPATPDYVLPGDANGDQRADMQDLLYVGLGYGQLGVPRPEASNDWAPQYAPDWMCATSDGVNHKHMDSDGDGLINDFDIDPMLANYQPLDSTVSVADPNLPSVRLEFAADTLYINPTVQSQVEITAHLRVGSPTQPVFGLYGLVCSVQYPEYVGHDPLALYDPSFLGQSNHTMSIYHDDHNKRQFDLGFVRKSGSGTSGYGRLATLSMKSDFIIIIDIIDRAQNDVIPLTMPVGGIKAVDALGNEILLSPAVTPDTLWIKIDSTISAMSPLLLDQRVQVAPNPAKNLTTVTTHDLAVQRINVTNALGQVVQSTQPTQQGQHQIDVSNWKSGTYTIQIIADQGVLERRIVVE